MLVVETLSARHESAGDRQGNSIVGVLLLCNVTGGAAGTGTGTGTGTAAAGGGLATVRVATCAQYRRRGIGQLLLKIAAGMSMCARVRTKKKNRISHAHSPQ